MKKEDLIALGLTEEQAQQVLDGFGTMVPKSRLDDKITEVNDLKQQITNHDSQLKDLQAKAAGNEELQNEITRLQQENATAKAEHESELQKRDFDYTLDGALRDAKAKNIKSVRANLNLEAIKLDGDKLLGLDEQLTALKASDDYLFVADGLRGNTPPNPGGGGKPQTLTRADFAKKPYEERLKLMQENPSLLSELK